MSGCSCCLWDLSLGLQHAEDFDIGLNGPVEVQAPVNSGVGSDDLTLVEAASVAEIVMEEGLSQLGGLDSQQSRPSSPNSGPGGVSPGDADVIQNIPNCGSGNVLDVVVVNEGDASRPGQSQIVVDECFNQVDEFDSQLSQSIQPNCGPDGVLSGGELLSCSQNNNVKESSLTSLSNDKKNESETNLSIENSTNESSGNINYYGSTILSDGTPRSTP